jgi:hypothetical protein
MRELFEAEFLREHRDEREAGTAAEWSSSKITDKRDALREDGIEKVLSDRG